MRNQIFFELLHQARRLRNELCFPWPVRRAYLLGMLQMYIIQAEDAREKQISMADPGCADAMADRSED